MALLTQSPAVALAEPGEAVPPGSTLVAPHRYRSPLSFTATLAALEKALRGRGNRVDFVPLVELPDVIAAHAESRIAGTPYSGVNVSEFENSVWIFYIPR